MRHAWLVGLIAVVASVVSIELGAPPLFVLSPPYYPAHGFPGSPLTEQRDIQKGPGAGWGPSMQWT
jgi:hypothetical protein